MKRFHGVNRASSVDAAYWLTHSDFRAFAAAMRDDPADDMPRLVAADWLQDRGDSAAMAYAEFIRESLRCPARLSKKAEALLDENLRAWVGPLFSLGKEGRVESISRKGAWVYLQLAYRPHPGWKMRAGDVRLRWRRGAVDRAEFGGRNEGGAPIQFLRLAARVATACPAAVMAPAQEAVPWWQVLSWRFRNRSNRTKTWSASVGHMTAQMLPAAGPSGRVVVDNAPDRRQVITLAQTYLTRPMTECAHHLASAGLQPASLVA